MGGGICAENRWSESIRDLENAEQEKKQKRDEVRSQLYDFQVGTTPGQPLRVHTPKKQNKTKQNKKKNLF